MTNTLFNMIETNTQKELGLDENQCNFVNGDYDYVCNPAILNMYKQYSLGEIENRIQEHLFHVEKTECKLVSLYLRKPGISEVEALTLLGKIMEQHPKLGFIVHFFEPKAVDALLNEYSKTPLLYSLTAEETSLKNAICILKNKLCPMVAQPVDENGIGVNVQKRIKVIEKISQAFEYNNIDRKYIYVDPLSPTVYFKPCSLAVSIKTLEYCKEHDIKTILWPENVARGYRENVNYFTQSYLSMAVMSGLDLAVLSSENPNVSTVLHDSNLLKEGIKNG